MRGVGSVGSEDLDLVAGTWELALLADPELARPEQSGEEVG